MAKKKKVVKKSVPVKKKGQQAPTFKKYQWMLLGAFVGSAVCLYFILTK